MGQLPDNALKVAAAARAIGLDISIQEMAASTRTAEEAAAACGVTVAQIVKSLVFLGAQTSLPYLLLVSGKNRVNEAAIAREIGEALTRPDASTVRALTGYAIGGIPPFGHQVQLKTYMDVDLMAHEIVWAAAGTPRTIFPVRPGDLQRCIGAPIIAVNQA